MTALAVALAAGYGAFLAATAALLGWTGVRPAPRLTAAGPGGRGGGRQPSAWQRALAVLGPPPPPRVAGSVAALAAVGGLAGSAVLGGPLGAVAGGVAAGAVPVAVRRRRRAARAEAAREAWPRVVEEVRVRTASGGRSIPQALFEAGASVPPELHGAFEAARREWALSTDLARALAVLRAELADPTADAACETLLVAHEVGGTDLDARLAELAEDRRVDLRHRRDARSRLAGARFARRFTLVVPAGMAVAGLSIGPGRAAYATPAGQAVVAGAMAVAALCWLWAGRTLRLPHDERVLP